MPYLPLSWDSCLADLSHTDQIIVLGHPCPPQRLLQHPLQGSQEVDALSPVFSPCSAVVQVVVGGLFREHRPLELPVSSWDQWEVYWLTHPQAGPCLVAG